MNENKKCPIENLLPFNFNDDKIKNIILILMTLKTIWDFFKHNSNKIDINDMILSNLCNSNDFIGQQIPNIIGQKIPNIIGPQIPNIIDKTNIDMDDCKGWNIFNFLLLGFFIYIIFFIKDIFENINLFSFQINKEELEKTKNDNI